MDFCSESSVLIRSFLLPIRLSVVFSNLGLKKGDSIHILAGNHHYALLSLFAAWYLGASASAGDIALDSDTIASQVICTGMITKKTFYRV